MFKNKDLLKKIGLISLWISVVSVALILLVAATRKNNSEACKEVIVDIKSGDQGTYISEKEVLDRISLNYPVRLVGSRADQLSLSSIETLLKQHLWIRNAEMFFDNKHTLHIEVEERVPVARVFSEGGESFYVDEKGVILPVNGNQIAKVAVFTGFPQMTYPLVDKDSLMLTYVRDLGSFIMKHPFWKAQIDQVHIDNYQMELIPKLGKHQILLGDGTMIEQKFKRLMLFYDQILKKAGWNYYSVLDLRFDKQLVAVRRDSASLYESFVIPFDTIEIRKELDSIRIAKDTSLTINVPSNKIKEDIKKADSLSNTNKTEKQILKSEVKKNKEVKKSGEEDEVLREVLESASSKTKTTNNKNKKP